MIEYRDHHENLHEEEGLFLEPVFPFVKPPQDVFNSRSNYIDLLQYLSAMFRTENRYIEFDPEEIREFPLPKEYLAYGIYLRALYEDNLGVQPFTQRLRVYNETVQQPEAHKMEFDKIVHLGSLLPENPGQVFEFSIAWLFQEIGMDVDRRVWKVLDALTLLHKQEGETFQGRETLAYLEDLRKFGQNGVLGKDDLSHTMAKTNLVITDPITHLVTGFHPGLSMAK